MKFLGNPHDEIICLKRKTNPILVLNSVLKRLRVLSSPYRCKWEYNGPNYCLKMQYFLLYPFIESGFTKNWISINICPKKLFLMTKFFSEKNYIF